MSLILFFSYRVSLETWAERGILGRETAAYRRMLPAVGGVAFVTYGAGDARFEPDLGGIRVLQRPARLGPAAMSLLAPLVHRRALAGATVLKTNQASGGWTGVVAKRLHRKPLVVRCGYPWSYVHARESGRPARSRLVFRLERLVVRAADRLVVSSPEVGAYLSGAHGVEAARVRVVPNHVDVARFAPGPPAARERGLVVSVGRLVAQKNLPLLVRAMRGLPRARLLVVGSGPERDALARLAADEGVTVEFAGTVPSEDLPALLARAEVFALPSPYEGQPKAALEAMACGLPVLGTDVPGVRDVVGHGETGWLCAPEPEAFGAGLRALLGDADLRSRLGAAARARVERDHALDVVVERELAVLRELAG